MASAPLSPIVSAFNLTTDWLSLYTTPSSPVLRTGIDASTFNNYSASNITYSVRIVQSGTGDVLNELITDKTIRSSSSDLSPEIIGQAILSGGVLQAKASANSSVGVNITGTIISADL